MAAAEFRYSRWDGTQRLDDLDAGEVLDTLSDDFMSYGDLRAALQRMLRWGNERMPGLEDLMQRLRDRREEELGRYNLDTTVEDLRRQLQEIVDEERAGIQRKVEAAPEEARRLLERMAAQRQDQLDRMPEDLGGRMQSLRDYEFMDGGARQKFEDLMQRLRQQITQQMFSGLKQSLTQMTQQDLSATREMLQALNEMLEQRARGERPDFEGFKQRFGQFFPPGIDDLDQLLEHLQRQMAQMQSLLDSLSPGARQELRDMMEQLLGDDALRRELAKLAAHMQQLMPPSEMSERYPFFGDEPLDLQQAMGLMGRLQDLDRLEGQLERGSFRLGDVDPGLLEQALGPQARQDLERLGQVTQVLEKAGFVERHGNRLQLTPRGLRRIGQGALRDIFEQLRKSRVGQHRMAGAGLGIDASDEQKPYEYGDPFLLNLKDTLFEALLREGPGVPLRILPQDFQIDRTEHTTQASTVLMIDMSRSMFLRGCFLAAKKVAIALDSLIRSQFPRDNLYVVGFSNHAVELKPQALPSISLNDYVYGTNMQDGFRLARALLARHRGDRQIIMITDGEPTAHTENGRVVFSYPPTYRTIEATLEEVGRVTRDHIVINTFMLEKSPYLTDFVNQMARINRGRAFYVSPERLGEFVLDDFVSGRRRRYKAS
ncbi:MAG: VWA domain-containing protein [Candidatus Dormibacteraceae bacterium]